MKTITKTTSGREPDSSLDATLNPVELSSKEIVAWGLAFPRPGVATRAHAPAWRTDGTIGTVLGVAGRMPARVSRPEIGARRPRGRHTSLLMGEL
jgi:hypothetical protein